MNEPGIQDVQPAGPTGALPQNLGPKLAGGVVLALLGIGLVMAAMQRACGSDEAAITAPPPETATADGAPPPQTAPAAAAEVLAEADRDRLEMEAARRELEARQNKLLAQAAQANALAGELLVEDSEAILEARMALRVAEIEREYRSLRTAPVAASLRATAPPPPTEASSAPEPAQPDPLAELDRRVMEATLAALNPPSSTAEAAPPPAPAPPPAAGVEATAPTVPTDPAGWERIHEGEFFEAVLQTQIDGEMTGPVAAMVAVDYYSRVDRRIVLVPQGSRALGSASAVGADVYAGRLAVSFHRIIFPDGSWIRMPFTGLNATGSTGLRDQVNRHYLQLFGATAAVGVLSGLALARQPQGSGGQNASISGGLGQATAQMGFRFLDRFLNRPPTITIRPGHRVRIWLASDILVPHPEGGTPQ